MNQDDHDPEHCGAEACLAECGCDCKECRATVKYMAECGNDEPTLDVHKQVSEFQKALQTLDKKRSDLEVENAKLLEEKRKSDLQNEEMKKALGLMLEKVLSETQYPHAFETCTAGYYPLDKCVTCGVQKMLGKGFADKREGLCDCGGTPSRGHLKSCKRKEEHHENCDTLDPFGRDKPCNCKRVVPTQKCGSYWDGNQCEGSQGHEGKHWFMGWKWVVDPPPLTCECGATVTPKGHACGYWKPSSGGLQS